MAHQTGDIENGMPSLDDRHRRDTVVDDEEKTLGEYQGLVRYISTYREGRPQIGDDAETDETPKAKKKWKFWQRAARGGSDGSGFETPEEWLNTDMKAGLRTGDVDSRRKRTGWNELTTEKENMFLKFLSYFTGPILYGVFVHS